MGAPGPLRPLRIQVHFAILRYSSHLHTGSKQAVGFLDFTFRTPRTSNFYGKKDHLLLSSPQCNLHAAKCINHKHIYRVMDFYYRYICVAPNQLRIQNVLITPLSALTLLPSQCLSPVFIFAGGFASSWTQFSSFLVPL